jgi:hypothetical protein
LYRAAANVGRMESAHEPTSLSEAPTSLSEDKIRDRTRALLRVHSPRQVARMLGTSRESTLGIAAGAKVTRGTLAVVREAFARIPCSAAP